MRDQFVSALTKEADMDNSIILLTADLGFGVFENFERLYPKQYINVGVAEQNMIGIATGLALEGASVVVYSIGNFPTLRCLEQIRNDACYHEINMTIVATGGGFSYGSLGMSHHATEDLAIMRALPGVTVIAPGTCWEAAEATKNLLRHPGVGYLRLDKSFASDDAVPQSAGFEIGKAIRFREGKDLTFICTGGIISEALAAAEILSSDGVECRVVCSHTVKPLDREEVFLATAETGGVVTIEEHNVIGGLGGAVAEYCMDEGAIPKYFHRIGLNDHYSSIVGSQQYLRSRYGMDAEGIVSAVRKCMENASNRLRERGGDDV